MKMDEDIKFSKASREANGSHGFTMVYPYEVMGRGQNEQLFPVAKDAAKLFPAVVAVLALRPLGNTLQKNHCESLNTRTVLPAF